ncbi:MAG: branched-chain alpha-keto acid dehydrogenase subunit E2, partial [Hyphomicrobiaceae bacterium]|nr:branched-chain alpha-keto acid dehydrogenase subunit E2 [Hyphomicrobiaceae bacterium]
MAKEIRIPDIGDFDNVPVIEVLVAAGDVIKQEDVLITLESDKATMDVPAPEGGKVVEVKVAVGDKVRQGSVILMLEAADGAGATTKSDAGAAAAPAATPVAAPAAAQHSGGADV